MRSGTIISFLEAVVGLALVLVALSDIFRTILLPRPTRRALRLAPLLGRAIVPLWLRLARRFRSSDTRQTLRGSLGPFLLVASLAVWVVLLLLGFGLLLHSVADEIHPAATLSDAIYYSASSFLTLGFAPAEAFGSARLITVAAGLAGLAGVTLAATFLVSLQSELNRREVLVLRTEVMTGRPPTGLALLESYCHAGMVDELAGLFRDWSYWSADVLHSHRANPILVHFRSADEDGEWLAVFGAALDAAALALGVVEHATIEAGVSSARLLIATGSRTAADLASMFRLPADPRDLQPARVAEEVRQARSRLSEVGFRVTGDEAEAIRTVQELRARYQPSLKVLCDHLGIVTARGLDGSGKAAVLDVIAVSDQQNGHTGAPVS